MTGTPVDRGGEGAKSQRMSAFRVVAGLSVLALVPFSSCSCQRKENIEAKERLSKPAEASPLDKMSRETLKPGDLATDEDMRHRINRMRFGEMQRRLGSMKYHSSGRLSFARAPLNVDSRETTDILYSDRGDFSVTTTTADGSRQELAYVNEIFFLKNKNGKWRTSRDPTGERIAYLEDAAGIWRSFYKLFRHTLELTPRGEQAYQGRNAYVYTLSVPDESKKARAEGAKVPAPKARPLADGGVLGNEPIPEETAEERDTRMDRLRKWRDRAHPAGGKGELWVDGETGVPLKVQFTGDLAVGDGPEPSVLHVELTTALSEIGKPHAVEPPQEAVDEITRKKWPTKPRKFLEEKGLVAPLPDEPPEGEAAPAAPPAEQ